MAILNENPNNFLNAGADKLQGITSRLGMGFNLHSAIKNLATGMNQNLIEASVHYSKKDLSKASGKILRLLPSFVFWLEQETRQQSNILNIDYRCEVIWMCLEFTII